MTTKINDNDLRTQKTRRAIKSTFQDLICETDARSISVSKVAGCAQINRKTFYLHYDCIEDLFDETVHEICAGLSDAFDKHGLPMSGPEADQVFFEYFTNQAPYVERIVCESSYRPYEELLLQKTVFIVRNALGFSMYLTKDDEDVMDHFFVRNLFDMYRRWIAFGKKIPVDRLVQLSNLHLYDDVSHHKDDDGEIIDLR